MNKVLNTYKSVKTGEIIKIWEDKEQYENHSFEFEQEWKQGDFKK